MSQPDGVCRWIGNIASRFPHLSKSQARGLAVYSLGLALARRCALAATAERLVREGLTRVEECNRVLSA